jgi:hypothetical protein
MKTKIFTLALTALAITAAVAQPSMAQSQGKDTPAEGHNRFNYRPNLWAEEKARTPGSRYAVPKQPMFAVGKGSMPGKSILGIDPGVLNHPKQLAPASFDRRFGTEVTPEIAQAAPQMVAPPQGLQAQPAPAFNPKFGNRREETPAVSTPQALPPDGGQANESLAGKMLSPRRSGGHRAHHAVAGRLLTPKATPAQAATAKELPIASYSKPAFGGGDWTSTRTPMSTKTDVSGKVLK